MRRSAQAGVAQVDLALVGIDPGRQFLVVVGGQAGLADERHRHFIDHAEVFEVVLDVERQLAVQRRHRRHADVVQQQRVAVGVGARHLGGADRAAGAGGVVHDDRRAQRLLQRFGQVAGHAVGRAAGRERHHQRHGLACGEILGVCADGGRGNRRKGKQFLHDVSDGILNGKGRDLIG
ncbi:hypothetical protein D9M69_489220 [compost metagenome]